MERNLIDTLDSEESHIPSWGQSSWYAPVKRITPDGGVVTIDVEVFLNYDGEWEVADVTRVHALTPIGQGLAILGGSVILLNEREQQDFLRSEQCQTIISDFADAEAEDDRRE